MDPAQRAFANDGPARLAAPPCVPQRLGGGWSRSATSLFCAFDQSPPDLRDLGRAHLEQTCRLADALSVHQGIADTLHPEHRHRRTPKAPVGRTGALQTHGQRPVSRRAVLRGFPNSGAELDAGMARPRTHIALGDCATMRCPSSAYRVT